MEGCPFAQRRVHLDFTERLTHEPLDHGESEPGAAPGALGGVERLEQPCAHLVGHTRTCVHYADNDGFPGLFRARLPRGAPNDEAAQQSPCGAPHHPAWRRVR